MVENIGKPPDEQTSVSPPPPPPEPPPTPAPRPTSTPPPIPPPVESVGERKPHEPWTFQPKQPPAEPEKPWTNPQPWIEPPPQLPPVESEPEPPPRSPLVESEPPKTSEVAPVKERPGFGSPVLQRPETVEPSKTAPGPLPDPKVFDVDAAVKTLKSKESARTAPEVPQVDLTEPPAASEPITDQVPSDETEPESFIEPGDEGQVRQPAPTPSARMARLKTRWQKEQDIRPGQREGATRWKRELDTAGEGETAGGKGQAATDQGGQRATGEQGRFLPQKTGGDPIQKLEQVVLAVKELTTVATNILLQVQPMKQAIDEIKRKFPPPATAGQD